MNILYGFVYFLFPIWCKFAVIVQIFSFDFLFLTLISSFIFSHKFPFSSVENLVPIFKLLTSVDQVSYAFPLSVGNPVLHLYVIKRSNWNYYFVNTFRPPYEISGSYTRFLYKEILINLAVYEIKSSEEWWYNHSVYKKYIWILHIKMLLII